MSFIGVLDFPVKLFTGVLDFLSPGKTQQPKAVQTVINFPDFHIKVK